jgi:hypothetical protein
MTFFNMDNIGTMIFIQWKIRSSTQTISHFKTNNMQLSISALIKSLISNTERCIPWVAYSVRLEE